MPPTCVGTSFSKAMRCAACSNSKSAQGAKFNSRKIPDEGEDKVDAVIAKTTSRSFTLGCIPPAEPIRMMVLTPKSLINSFA